MSAWKRLEDARRSEREARANWFRSLDLAQARFAPEAITQKAVSQIKTSAGEAVQKVAGEARKRPGLLIVAGTALGLFLFRKPIASAVRAKIAKSSETVRDFHTFHEQNITESVEGEDAAPVTIITEEV